MDLFRELVLTEEAANAYEFLVRGSERSEVHGRIHDTTLERCVRWVSR